MKLYIIFFIALCMQTVLNATLTSEVNDVVTNLKREYVGPSLVSTKDPRVIALIAAGVITMGCSCWLMNSALNKKEIQQSNFFKNALAFINGDVLMVIGIFEIFLSRLLITAVDEYSYKVLQEFNARR